MSTVQVVEEVIVARISPASVCTEKRSLTCPAVPAEVEDRLASAVAGEAGLRAIGVEDPHPGDEPGLGWLGHQHDPVGADTEVPVAQPLDPSAGELEGQRPLVEDQVVVAECLPPLEVHGAADW